MQQATPSLLQNEQIKEKLGRILPKVEKPARYMGAEPGSAEIKADSDIRFLLAFPDVYEVGMSHLGSIILYHMINERQDASAERAYAVFPDMRAAMKEAGVPLYSLETYTPASEFDFIGFNLSYEMCYTTLLSMLELAGLPLLASERDGLPLVVAGGGCAYNPEPLADFVDFFIVGDGEEVTNEYLDLYKRMKPGFKKEEFLRAVSEIEGIYVPSLYNISYNSDGTLAEIQGKTVKKRYVEDFDNSYFPKKLIVPYLGIVHDRIALEIMRGCSRGCRFCQAGMTYRPVRERNHTRLREQARELVENTGYEEISLCSLSSGDYSHIGELAIGLLDEMEPRRVSVSLPSLRVDSFSDEYARRMQSARKSSYTFAPEAGTQRMRDVINKNVSEEDLLRSVRLAYESGATTIKLYFMIGLPTETYADLDGIVELTQKAAKAFYGLPKEQRKGRLSIHVSASSFVPKPDTPFQWEPQDSMEELREKQRYLKEKFSSMKSVRFNWHDVRLSFLEAVFAVGDRRLSRVLQYARQAGAEFDSWQDYFDFDRWLEAFSKAGIDPHFYANRTRGENELLPWEHIDCLISKKFLINEVKAAKLGSTTPDCRLGCNGCGLEGRCPNV